MKRVMYLNIDYNQGTDSQNGEKQIKKQLKCCDIFSENEIDHIYSSAKGIEQFVKNIYRLQFVEESYKELLDIKIELLRQKCSHGDSERIKVERRMRSFFIEIDVFLAHWEKYLASIKKKSGVDIYGLMLERYKEEERYQIIDIVRNYIMHSGDIISGAHFGMYDMLLWADTQSIKGDTRDKKSKRVLEGFKDKIDLFELADNMYILIQEIQDFFMSEIAKRDANLKNECEYLLSIFGRIVLYKANEWYVMKFSGINGSQINRLTMKDYPGFKAEYVKLDWGIYQYILDWYSMNANELVNG